MKLVVLALSWLLGMAAVALWQTPPWAVAAWLVLAAPVVTALLGRRALPWLALCAALALVAGFRFEGWFERETPGWTRALGREVTITGRINSEPDPGRVTVAYNVAVDQLSAGEQAYDGGGQVRISLNQYAEYLPGDRVVVRGEIESAPAFPGFDYRRHLAQRDVFATMLYPRVTAEGRAGASAWRRQLTELRLDLERSLSRALPEPQASLGAGVAFGRDGNLAEEVKENFRVTGLAHIVAVSGSNVTLVSAMTFLLFVPAIGRRRALAPAALTVLTYLAIAGFSASVVRAGVMALVFLLGEYVGRPQAGLAALGLAAIAMTAYQPATAQDVGFQLSLSATAGLIVFGPWIRYGLDTVLRRAGTGSLIPPLATQVAALSLSATLATLPIIWVTFGRVSLVGPLANVVVQPIFAIAFWASAATAALGLMSDDAGWVAGLVAYYPLAFITWFAFSLAGVPFASVALPAGNGTGALIGYAVLSALGWPAYRYLVPGDEAGARAWAHERVAKRIGFATAVMGLGVAVALVSLRPVGGPGRLEVAFLDVGQGDAILVTTPKGSRILIDAGPSGRDLGQQLDAVLPHWERSIDALLITHPQEDHVGGAARLLDLYDVGEVFENGRRNRTATVFAYERGARDRRTLRTGEQLAWDGVTFEVLWPDPAYESAELNNTSLVLLVSYGTTSFLLPGDIEASAQQSLFQSTDVSADVLKVPHHGSQTNAERFLREVGAKVAVVSVGAGNNFGHPAQQVLDALSGAPLLRTDLHGRVTVTSDGTRVSVRRER